MNPKYCWSSLKSSMKTFTAKIAAEPRRVWPWNNSSETHIYHIYSGSPSTKHLLKLFKNLLVIKEHYVFIFVTLTSTVNSMNLKYFFWEIYWKYFLLPRLTFVSVGVQPLFVFQTVCWLYHIWDLILYQTGFHGLSYHDFLQITQ